MTEFETALIALKVYSSGSISVLKDALQSLNNKLPIERISSVYRVHRDAEDFFSLRSINRTVMMDGLCCVVKIQSNKSPIKIAHDIFNVENELSGQNNRRLVSLHFLLYGSHTIMNSDLLLPHPEFHLRPEEIIPAVEVWPEGIHPIIEKPLIELSRAHIETNWGEFFTQSDSLLDLSITKQ